MVEFSVNTDDGDEPPPPDEGAGSTEVFSVVEKSSSLSSLAQALYETLWLYHAADSGSSEDRKSYLLAAAPTDLPEVLFYGPSPFAAFRSGEGLYRPPLPEEMDDDPLSELDTFHDVSELAIDYGDLDRATFQYLLDSTPSLGIDEVDALQGVTRETEQREYVFRRWLYTVGQGTGKTAGHSSLTGYLQ